MYRFIEHMEKYMLVIHPSVKYKIVIIEQDNEHPFNRGLLLNAGFLERERDISHYIKYYIHHNCDLFPDIDFRYNKDKVLDYTYTPINEVRDIFGYSGGIGGIAIFNRHTFSLIKGFPNDYYVWGHEDCTLYKRCEYHNIDIKRKIYNKGILEETHIRDSSFNSINQRKGQYDNPESNGIDTCKYRYKINTESEYMIDNEGFKRDNIVHYLIDFDYL